MDLDSDKEFEELEETQEIEILNKNPPILSEMRKTRTQRNKELKRDKLVF